MKRNTTAANDALAGEAAQWFTAMQAADVPARERAQFCEWLERSPHHVNEYLSVAACWRDLDHTGDARRSAAELIALARAEEGATNVVALPGSSVHSVPDRTNAESGNRRWLAAACFVLACCAAGLAAWFMIYRSPAYSTSIGEQTSFVLADGSTVRLNTQSKIRVKFSEQGRDISLLSGEAMFEVAADAHRPFRVHVDKSVVEALGTAFNIYRVKGETRVTVLEGRVAVSSPGEVGARIELTAGERVTAVPEAVLQKESANTAATLAWTSRRLIFDSETLQTVVDEFNRYNPQRLELIDPQLAELRINGNFRATDPQSLVQFLEHTESVEATAGPGGSVQLSRKK